MTLNPSNAQWLNPPQHCQISPTHIELTTDPGTDFWQRSYYGFRNDNAPALLWDYPHNFTFTVQATFHYQQQFDQCGVIIYVNSDNWFKASIEHENAEFSRLGSVVTNNGYSDWATTDIATVTSIWYRLSRRGPDFLIESAANGRSFRQMRIFHLHCLGETTAAMGQQNPPAPPTNAIRFGLYACSPLQSSFTAVFTSFTLEDCLWLAHPAP